MLDQLGTSKFQNLDVPLPYMLLYNIGVYEIMKYYNLKEIKLFIDNLYIDRLLLKQIIYILIIKMSLVLFYYVDHKDIIIIQKNKNIKKQILCQITSICIIHFNLGR